ncbi:MAG: hypothetical protein ABIT20_06735 [Gemmatimonadaceae bacterium]
MITFFMPVTDRDMVIADYSVRSYAKLTGIPFTLVIYSNWVLSSLRAKYFPRWRELPFVEIWENPEHTDDRKPSDKTLWGPFELCYPMWDRELKKLTATPFHATVDADCEILDEDFVHTMLARFDAHPRLIAMSTDYNPRIESHFESYSNRVITLNERWHTHFCIYRRAALDCPVSHAYFEDADGVWDDAGYFQRALRLAGHDLEVLDRRYRRSYIHYGAFGQNRHIDENNVALYRRLMIIRRTGVFSLGDPVSRVVARVLGALLFRKADRSTYAAGWSQ